MLAVHISPQSLAISSYLLKLMLYLNSAVLFLRTYELCPVPVETTQRAVAFPTRRQWNAVGAGAVVAPGAACAIRSAGPAQLLPGKQRPTSVRRDLRCPARARFGCAKPKQRRRGRRSGRGGDWETVLYEVPFPDQWTRRPLTLRLKWDALSAAPPCLSSSFESSS